MPPTASLSQEVNPPLIFAERNTILHSYAVNLLAHGMSYPTIEHPQQPLPFKPNAVQPHFLLADVSNLETRPDWLERIYDMRLRWPHIPVGIVTSGSGKDRAAAYTAGATETFTKKTPFEQIYHVLRNTRVDVKVSERKAQILISYSAGRNQKQVADELFIMPETVKSHVKDMFASFRCHSTPMLVNAAFEHGLLASPHEPFPFDDFPLTPVETMVLITVGRTGSQAEAASLLNRSVFTVKTHAQNVRKRTGWSVVDSISNTWRWGIPEDYWAHTDG